MAASVASRQPPVFRDAQAGAARKYVADTCEPLVQAAAKQQIALHALARGQYPGQRLPAGVLGGVKSVGYWDASRAQEWGLDWHRNEGIELTLLDSGRMPFSVDDKDFTLKLGDLTITRPWQMHRVGNPHVGAGRLHWLIFDVEVRRPHQSWQWPSWIVLSKADVKELTHILRHNEQPVWRATDELRRTFQRVGRLIEGANAERNLSRLAVCLNELFVELLEMCRSSDAPLDESLSSSCRSVSLFLTDLASKLSYLAQEWTVPRMAKECGLGTTQFIRHCKQITNATPLQFLNESRLAAAKVVLVEQPNRNITQIALDCGFSSSQYFATAFRRHFGCSPHELRG